MRIYAHLVEPEPQNNCLRINNRGRNGGVQASRDGLSMHRGVHCGHGRGRVRVYGRKQKAMMTPRHARRIDLPAELVAPSLLPRANRRASFLAIFIAESFMNSNLSLCVGVSIGSAGLHRKQGILRNEMEFQRARGPNSECPASLRSSRPRNHYGSIPSE